MEKLNQLFLFSIAVPFVGLDGVNNLAAINLYRLNDSSVFRGEPQRESKC